MNNQEIVVTRRKHPFAQIDNNVFLDNRISYKAKGILAYILSKPKDWKVIVKDLYNHTTEGYCSIRTGINELILTGYMELRTKYDSDNNVFKGRKYFLYEEPLFKEGFRLPENKNKNFSENEEIVTENPLGNRKIYK